MTTELAVRQTATNIDEIQRVAKLLAASGYFDAKGSSEQAIAQIATKILAGREMGYGEFTSVQGIHVIQGKPTMSANLMAASVKASARYDYRVRQMEDAIVSVEFFERVGGKLETLGVSTFTAEDAKKAGTQNMAKFGRNMLFARAMSNGVRWYCPDVFFGNSVYTPEEMGTDGNGEFIDVDYRNVDTDTGEIKPPPPVQNNAPPAPAAPKSTAQPLDVPPEVAMWESPNDAYEWAIGIGASDNLFAARNAMTKIVEAHGGKFTKSNATAIYVAYYHERMARAQEKAKAALDAMDMEAVTEADQEGVFA